MGECHLACSPRNTPASRPEVPSVVYEPSRAPKMLKSAKGVEVRVLIGWREFGEFGFETFVLKARRRFPWYVMNRVRCPRENKC